MPQLPRPIATDGFHEGGKSHAICTRCACVVQTTLARRDVPFSDGRGIAKAILVAVCDQCGEVVAVPGQATPDIQAQLAALKR